MLTQNANLLLAEYKRAEKLMGNAFEITVVAEDEQWANEKIDTAIAEIRRIEKLLTTFDESSQTNQVNKQAGIAAVKVDKEVFDLIPVKPIGENEKEIENIFEQKLKGLYSKLST